MFQKQLTFQEAVQRALTVNYCNFSGRASRSEYWWFALFTFVLGMVLGLVLGIIFSDTMTNILTGIVNLALFLPSLGLSVRRMHDVDRSGWWVLINFIPVIGWILYIYWAAQPSKPTPNQWGPVPNVTA